MTAPHTPGRLVVAGTRLREASKDAGIDCIATMQVSNQPNWDADARRLAACWNAFDGAETEAIENLADSGGVVEAANGAVKVITRLAAARTELAAARALLREVLDGTEAFVSALECNDPFDGEAWAARARSYLDACDTLGGGSNG